jgi:chromate transporter
VNVFFLYALFFRMGLFAVGGGLATLPFLFQMAGAYDWLSPEMVGNYLAIAQSAPGPVGVNMAALTGFQYSGVSGSVLAVSGLISPAIVVILIVARMLQSFKENKIVVSVFTGLRPAAAGLLAAAGFGVWKLTLWNTDAVRWRELFRWKESLLFILLFGAIFRFKLHPLWYVLIAGAAGLVFKL